ncbi:MAG TPA: heavy metal-binding domain-containing protein [Pseudonocardiaceae bacterium]|nr:heavy metal-binding domain-containing protein [Pseudonocardiaceae bacterium]
MTMPPPPPGMPPAAAPVQQSPMPPAPSGQVQPPAHPPAMDPRQLGVPDSAMARLAQLRPGSPTTIFTSDLSVGEFLLVRKAGFRPLGMVMGTSIYHVGFQAGNWNQNMELGVLSQATYNARHLAMSRMQAEADQLGADGIVGVDLVVRYGLMEHAAEFVAIGTAVKADDNGRWRDNQGRPFTSALSGQEFWALLQAGYAPVGMVLGCCVYHFAHRSMKQMFSSVGQNVEIPQFTQALYDARELAMDRMQREAEALGAEGVVGVGISEHGYGWSSHAMEYLSIGTAVRPLRADHTIPDPQLVLGL